MASFSKFGNDLYTGKRSFDIVGRRRIWFIIAGALVAIALILPVARHTWTFGLDFVGGSEFQVAGVQETDQTLASDTVLGVVPDADPRVATVGTDSIRVQTNTVTSAESTEIQQALATAFKVDTNDVSASFVGPSWGADVTSAAIRALVIFLALVIVVMAIYFRTWKMSIAAVVALLHDLILTAGVYGVFGIEVSPDAVIGFLTILGYSLYDTVVVFDKIREYTREDANSTVRTIRESINLAINQTLVRSINTSVVALLPVAAILFIGSALLGAGTLRDIALALFIGILAGTYSTIFIAAPLYAWLREREPENQKRAQRILAQRAASLASTDAVAK
jgi:preprotein translocase subunit SecF